MIALKSLKGNGLDTSFVSAFINPLDLHHEEAMQIYSKLDVGESVFIPNTVILELEVFPKAKRSDEFYYIVEEFLNQSVVEKIDVDESILIFSKEINRSIPDKLTAIDLSVLATCIKYNCELLTFDRKLHRVFEEIKQSF